MKTRIEVWVDCDVPQDRIEEIRHRLEQTSWGVMNNFLFENSEIDKSFIMVQANEVAAP